LLSLALGFAAGCVPSFGLPLTGAGDPPAANPPVATATPPPAPAVASEKELPKRPPQAATCVAFGNLQLEAAKEAKRTPAQRQELCDTARKYFQQALKTDPKCADAYHGLTRAYEGLGDQPRTIEAFQKAQRTFPKDASFCFELGMYQARRKDWSAALESLTKATDLAPENRTYANMRGYCLARMGRYDESFAWFKQTVGEAQAHYNVARMLHHIGQEEPCRRHLALALQADPNLSDARQLTAELNAPVRPAGASPSPEVDAPPVKQAGASGFASQRP
jgi:tetratricopeptide (TPR) repeat protein